MKQSDPDACYRAIQTSLLLGDTARQSWAFRIATRIPDFTEFLAKNGYHIYRP